MLSAGFVLCLSQAKQLSPDLPVPLAWQHGGYGGLREHVELLYATEYMVARVCGVALECIIRSEKLI